ncbi:NERD domain-containing protein [Streptomyces durbertensis]|uniref:NERD domain-containing protein n=1 Tax=Streptomyces durbertensis TaxID=2448886 RepID=A0ABR6ECJ7_9ACTN|nr:NERD domain-containing protein [Streptomyces durbertensis]MBB1243048.1 NERD domain-containing protein [Streptomyces durbertensis]
MDVPARPHSGGSLWLHPDDDLAPNRPGEHLYARLETPPPAAPVRLARRLLGRPDPLGRAARERAAARRVAAELDALEIGGWRALHALPLPAGAYLDHLLVGPGGLFAVRAAWCDGVRVRVDRDLARLGRGRVRPLPRECLRAAALASHTLGRALGRPVRARAALVVVGARAVSVEPEVAGLLVLRERELAGFGRRGGVLSPAAVDALHQSARDRRTWLPPAAT